MKSLYYYISCEGETEIWYFDWLKEQINNHPNVKRKVSFSTHKGTSPTSYAKSNRSVGVKSKFCRVQDIEDYDDTHIKNFDNLCKATKQASKLLKSCEFSIGYSNYTFEVWILAHRQQVPMIVDRFKYYQHINRVYGFQFLNNDDYKKEKNFKALLKLLSLNDVINNALPECARIRQHNENFNQNLKRQCTGFTYFITNPDTTLDKFVQSVLVDAGIL